MASLQSCSQCGAGFDVSAMAPGSEFPCGACGERVIVASPSGDPELSANGESRQVEPTSTGRRPTALHRASRPGLGTQRVPAESAARHRRVVLIVAIVAGVLLIGGVLWTMLRPAMVAVAKRQRIERARENVAFLVGAYRSAGALEPGNAPRLSGKRFVLWLVANGTLDRRDPKALARLFSPSDPSLSAEKAGLAAYAALTPETLADRTHDVSRLTSYAGLRNGDKEHAIRAKEDLREVPLLADLSIPGVVIVGYADGRAAALSWDDLNQAVPEEGFVPIGDQGFGLLERLSFD